MEAVVLVLAVLAAALVMACGVWVALVLIATVARTKRSSESVTRGRAGQRPNP
jgi:hypothetical protein